MELRITTGSAKNKKLSTPDIPGYRAVQEIAKSSLFSIVGDRIEGAVCLDLFAGSGNLGLEALSRGAAWCDFVDTNAEAISVIKQNLENCGFTDKGGIYMKRAVKFVASTNKIYDFIFLDPFYNDLSQIHLLKGIHKNMGEDSVLFYFHSKDTELVRLLEATCLEIADTRQFGTSVYDILKRKRGC